MEDRQLYQAVKLVLLGEGNGWYLKEPCGLAADESFFIRSHRSPFPSQCPSARVKILMDKYWILKRCDLFGNLHSDRLQALESRCRFREFPRNSAVYFPAEQADGVLLLASGRIKICSVATDGKQSILAFIEPGELFGELALVEPTNRGEYAEAVSRSRVLLIPREALHDLMVEQPSVSIGITKLIGLRRKRIERRLSYLLFHSNRERLVHLLLELLGQYGHATAQGWDVGIQISHQELANIIGSSRETVTIQLGELQADGLLTTGRRRIIVTDLPRLAAILGTRLPLPNGAGDPAMARDR